MGVISINNEIGLDELEKKAWTSTFDDGLFDIYFGILIASFGPNITFYGILPEPLNILIGPILIGLGFAIFILGKKYLVKPRIGTVKFGRKRKVRKLKTLIILSINVVFLLIIYLLSLSTGGSIILPYLIEGLIFLTLPLCFVAYFIQFNRLYIYAVVLGCAFFIADVSSIFIPIPWNFFFVYFLLGGILIIIGTFYLIKFLKKYQLPREEIKEDV